MHVYVSFLFKQVKPLFKYSCQMVSRFHHNMCTYMCKNSKNLTFCNLLIYQNQANLISLIDHSIITSTHPLSILTSRE